MLNIAAIQMDASTDNLARANALVAEAARAGAGFAVLPELAGCPWLPAREEEGLLAMAEPDDGPTLRALRAQVALKTRNRPGGGPGALDSRIAVACFLQAFLADQGIVSCMSRWQ
ncbi:MAG: nitrilase-related carbon-nitrogen hydrolase [Bacillota bacterium]